MATYLIGDVHGCFRTFRKLLSRIDFKRSRDELYFVGDLVNRGPRSLDMLRWAFDHKDIVTPVLGNHELHLLGRARGHRSDKKTDTFDELLDARDADKLLRWVRSWPLVIQSEQLLIVHAGVHPAWTLDETLELSDKAEARLRDKRGNDLIDALHDKNPADWSETLRGQDRACAAIRVLTRARLFRNKDLTQIAFAGSPDEAPQGCAPWYKLLDESFRKTTVITGHWAALGYHASKRAISIDTGCVYGGTLSALRLDKLRLTQEALCDTF